MTIRKVLKFTFLLGFVLSYFILPSMAEYSDLRGKAVEPQEYSATPNQIITGNISTLQDLGDQIKLAREYANMAIEARDVVEGQLEMKKVLELTETPDMSKSAGLPESQVTMPETQVLPGAGKGILDYLDKLTTENAQMDTLKPLSDKEKKILLNAKSWVEKAVAESREGAKADNLSDLRVRAGEVAINLMKADEGYDANKDGKIADDEAGIKQLLDMRSSQTQPGGKMGEEKKEQLPTQAPELEKTPGEQKPGLYQGY